MTKSDVNLLLFQGFIWLLRLGAGAWIFTTLLLWAVALKEALTVGEEWKDTAKLAAWMTVIAATTFFILWYTFLPETRSAQ